MYKGLWETKSAPHAGLKPWIVPPMNLSRSDRVLRTLMVHSESTWRGGESQLELLMRGLREAEVSVSLCAPPRSPIWERAGRLGVTCLSLSVSGGFDLKAAWGLRGYLRATQFDIIHCHSSHAHSTAFIARRLLDRAGTADAKPPALVVSRRVDFPVGRNGLSALKYRIGADMYLAISRGVREVLVRCGVPENRVELVPSGIDLDKFARIGNSDYLMEEFGLGGDELIIGNVAALAPHKSQVDFIRAAKTVASELPQARFFIVGEGALREKLESLIDEMGLRGKVVLTGFRQDVLEILSIFDCFVLSSYLEGLCTSVMDAQVLGVPVVATRTGGVPELVEDGVSGLLVPVRRPDLLAAAIVRMLTEAGLKERCSAAGRERAASYDYRRMVQGTMNAYEKILRSRAMVH
jgi:glycosyltransferase involved in cell wall biosynthesis